MLGRAEPREDSEIADWSRVSLLVRGLRGGDSSCNALKPADMAENGHWPPAGGNLAGGGMGLRGGDPSDPASGRGGSGSSHTSALASSCLTPDTKLPDVRRVNSLPEPPDVRRVISPPDDPPLPYLLRGSGGETAPLLDGGSSYPPLRYLLRDRGGETAPLPRSSPSQPPGPKDDSTLSALGFRLTPRMGRESSGLEGNSFVGKEGGLLVNLLLGTSSCRSSRPKLTCSSSGITWSIPLDASLVGEGSWSGSKLNSSAAGSGVRTVSPRLKLT